jgi:hypothetical protein
VRRHAAGLKPLYQIAKGESTKIMKTIRIAFTHPHPPRESPSTGKIRGFLTRFSTYFYTADPTPTFSPFPPPPKPTPRPAKPARIPHFALSILDALCPRFCYNLEGI